MGHQSWNCQLQSSLMSANWAAWCWIVNTGATERCRALRPLSQSLFLTVWPADLWKSFYLAALIIFLPLQMSRNWSYCVDVVQPVWLSSCNGFSAGSSSMFLRHGWETRSDLLVTTYIEVPSWRGWTTWLGCGFHLIVTKLTRTFEENKSSKESVRLCFNIGQIDTTKVHMPWCYPVAIKCTHFCIEIYSI